jgi:hypothetical protein
MQTNTLKRKALALAAVLLLSVPSAIGVQHALAPTRGPIAAWMGAAGFEAVYLSTAILILSTELRRYAQRIALAAVVTAVVLNTIADYGTRNPHGLMSAGEAWARFDGLLLLLSLVESLPLAGLSFAMASLLHRLAEQEASPAERPADASPFTLESLLSGPALAYGAAEPTAEYAVARVQTDGVASQSVQTVADRVCKYCGERGLSAIEVARHGRERKRRGHCPPPLEARWDATGAISYHEV